MPMLVGDLIIGVRALIPDMPQTVPTPAAPVLAQVAGGALPLGTYTVQVTALTAWGETDAGSAQITLAGGNQTIGVTLTAVPLALSYRIYLAAQGLYWSTAALAFNITTLATGFPGVPPPINRAWLPDTDGSMFPAYNIYSWMREALNLASDITGGMYDATGVNSVSGTAMYQLGTQWKRFTHAWWDGWQLGLGNKGDAFYRNKITATTGIVFTDVRGLQAIIEYYPVPSRTGGQTTASGAVALTDTTINCANLSNFLLAYGLAQIDNEIIAYQSLNGGQLTGCLRGLGGTVAVAHNINAPVLELNGRFAGYRYATVPLVGSANNSLDVPQSWEAYLPLYMEAKYRTAERRFKEAQGILQQFESGLKRNASSNRQLMLTGPRQIGEQYLNETYGSGAAMGGGWLLP